MAYSTAHRALAVPSGIAGVVPHDRPILAHGDDMGGAVPLAHQPHAGTHIRRAAAPARDLIEPLRYAAGQTAMDSGLKLPGQRQAQQRHADQRRRAAFSAIHRVRSAAPFIRSSAASSLSRSTSAIRPQP